MFNWLFKNKKEEKITPLSYLQLLSTPLVEGDFKNSSIIQRVLKKHPEWTEEYVRTLISQYKRFLHLAANSEEECVPTKDVDEVWHEHILFTKDYFERWSSFLGKVVHHNPEKFGEYKDYSSAFEKTQTSLKELTKKPIVSKKKKSVVKPAVSKSNSSAVHYSNNPALDPIDCFLVSNAISNVVDECSHNSHSNHSEASHCSSASCSSSSCGGGGGGGD